MAKSLRSKRKRKVRAEKRIVNAKKELVKLREVAARLHGSTSGHLSKESMEDEDLPDVQISEGIAPMLVDGDSMDNTIKSKRGIRINTQWMNQRKIKAIKSKIKKHNVKKARRGRGGRKK